MALPSAAPTLHTQSVCTNERFSFRHIAPGALADWHTLRLRQIARQVVISTPHITYDTSRVRHAPRAFTQPHTPSGICLQSAPCSAAHMAKRLPPLSSLFSVLIRSVSVRCNRALGQKTVRLSPMAMPERRKPIKTSPLVIPAKSRAPPWSDNASYIWAQA